MRYRGQSFDITVPLSAAFATGEDLSAVREPFHQTYERVYGFCDRDAPVEIINARVTIVGVTPKPAAVPTRAATSGPRPAEPIATRSVLEYRQQVVANVFQWDALGVGETFTGPAIVEAVDTTVYVPTGFAAEIDAWGNIIAEDVRDAN
jgi:N-methylhydantoinase A